MSGEATERGPQPSCPPRFDIHAWLQLLRVPNLLTVPGDPVAGFLLASWVFWDHLGPLRWPLATAGASLFLYAAGLVHNDICDLAEDRVERPHRPLPSGRIRLRSAWAAYFGLSWLGLGSALAAGRAPLVVAIILAVMSWFYNRYAKSHRVFGPLMMGLCRGLSLLMGMASLASCLPVREDVPAALLAPWTAYRMTGLVLGHSFLLTAVLGLTVYIAAVTWIARGETRARPLGPLRFLPGAVLAAWCASWLAHAPGIPVSAPGWIAPPGRIAEIAISLAALAVAAAHAMGCGAALRRAPEPAVVQRTVGRFIRGLLLIQAALASLAGWPGLIVAAGLLVLWPIQSRLTRRFYSS